MTPVGMMKYFGWSAISIETDGGVLTFDPFFRPYCGASWFQLSDFRDAKYICVTHGHEEHFLDVPLVAKTTGATVIGAPSVCSFLTKRRGIDKKQLVGVDPHKFETTATIPGCRITVFPWKHRDINLMKALSKAVFSGNATQLSWAWSSATQAPFYAPYTGFYLEFSNGLRVLNYNEGFNTKMTDKEIEDLGARFQTDVLLAGMQLDFVDDVVRGVAALKPKAVVLYPPHEKFHEMMGAKSRPWSEFESAINARFPDVKTYVAAPGDELDLNTCAAA
jgi:hypothetical protein